MSGEDKSMNKNIDAPFNCCTAAKKKILIVDDNAVNRRLLVKTLERDYSITEAENGKEALDALRTFPNSYSLILLDIIMPVMDGYAFLAEQQTDERLSDIPVIVTTQKDGEENEIKALSLGAADFISKPYKPQIIIRRIANILRLRETAAIVSATINDEVTGVYNREFFYKKAEDIFREADGRKFDVICCKVMRFELINDLFGKKTGDELLKCTALTILKSIGGSGICGRIGADKFACLIPHRGDYCASMFEAAISEINKYPVSISIDICYGIYAADDTSVPVAAMCGRALLACDSVKEKYNVHYAYYDDSMMQSMLAEQTLLDDMKTAIAEGQFEIYYQPKYDIVTDTVSGAEALVRWKHPQKGFIAPADFIPLFEKNGFITQLDLYVWDTVCRSLHDWIAAGNKHVPISVNVSRIDIYNPKLTDIFVGLINKYGLKPEQLHLEITETAYTENSAQLIEVVKKLRSIGFIIEMDDFGSGYSSLNMLSELPLDILKLDWKFIQNETAKNSSKSILSFIITLAKWLNLLVIAEGVETRNQLDLLRNMDCNYVQGYYFAKPMPRGEFEEHLRHSQISAEQTPNPETAGSDFVSIKKSGSGQVMMIVDDVELNRAILSEIFSKYYTIVESDNGKTAYDYILKNHNSIDIILLDLIMPIMDGFALLEKIKSCDEISDIPVVITSQASDDREAKALELGAADFIAKPYNPNVALRRVNNVLSTCKVIKLEEEKAVYQRMKEMEHKAKTDALTGLFNRGELETQVNAFFSEKNNSYSLFIILDIDNFKLVNDRLGHAKGDEAIRKVAKILTGCFRDNDILCRIGGDEFSVFIKGQLSMDKLSARLGMLCEKLRFMIEDMRISCSVGACPSPAYGKDYQTLYQNADMALMTAKRLGKNQYQIFGDDTALPPHVLFRNMDWLMDEASDAVMVCDANDFDILYLNDVACGIAQKSKKECMGKKCYEALWNLSSPCEHCVAIDKLSRDYCEHEVSPCGTDKSYIIKGKLVDWGGKPARIQYIQDNTSQAAIAKQLADISADRKRLLDLMPGGIFRYSAQEGDTFDFVSRNMMKMLGYTKEQFKDKFKNSFSNMVWHEDRERVQREIAEQIAKGDTDECDYRIEKADGELCWVHDVGRLVYDENGKAWFYVTIVDITSLWLSAGTANAQCSSDTKENV